MHHHQCEVLRIAVAAALTALSITVAPFSAMLGLLGFAERLLDTSRSENTLAGVLFLVTAVLIWIATIAWYVACYVPPNRWRVRWRFSLRTLLITMTIVAVVLGLIVLAAGLHSTNT